MWPRSPSNPVAMGFGYPLSKTSFSNLQYWGPCNDHKSTLSDHCQNEDEKQDRDMTLFKEKTMQQCEHNSTWFISVNVPWRCMFFPGSCSVWTRCQWGMGHPTPGWCHVPAREPCFCPGTRRSALKHTMLSCQCGRQRLYNVTGKNTTLHVCWIILGEKYNKHFSSSVGTNLGKLQLCHSSA